MPEYRWPAAEQRTLIGKRISRVDSPEKVSGQAKYTYDVKLPECYWHDGPVAICEL